MRVVFYARYSSDKQKASSIDDQFRNCENWLKAGRLTPEAKIIERFVDDAITGKRKDRPGYQDLLNFAYTGGFDVLLVDELSRLGRDSVESEITLRQLKFRGIRVIGVSEGYDSTAKGNELHSGIRGVMNEIYLVDLAEKTHRGLSGNALKGHSTGGRLYGYKTIYDEHPSDRDEFGRPRLINPRWVIDDQQAQWVRQIYEWYADGWSTKNIVEELNRRKIPSPFNKMWAITAIYGGRTHIGTLSNQTYTGKRVWNLKEFGHHPETGKRVVKRIRPESEWLVFDAPELRIVSHELWDRVKTRREMTYAKGQEKRKESENARQGAGPKYLLSGILVCGSCGSPYTYSGYRYACAGNKTRGMPYCSNRVTVKRELAERKILEAIREYLFQEDAIRQFVQEFTKHMERLAPSIGAEISNQNQKVADAEKRIGNLIAAIEAGIVTTATRSALEKAETDKAEAEAALANLTSSSAQTSQLDPEVIVAAYRARIRDLGNSFGANLPKAREIIKQLVGNVALSPNGDGKLEAEVRGALGGLIDVLPPAGNFAHQGKYKSGCGGRT